MERWAEIMGAPRGRNNTAAKPGRTAQKPGGFVAAFPGTQATAASRSGRCGVARFVQTLSTALLPAGRAVVGAPPPGAAAAAGIVLPGRLEGDPGHRVEWE